MKDNKTDKLITVPTPLLVIIDNKEKYLKNIDWNNSMYK